MPGNAHEGSNRCCSALFRSLGSWLGKPPEQRWIAPAFRVDFVRRGVFRVCQANGVVPHDTSCATGRVDSRSAQTAARRLPRLRHREKSLVENILTVVCFARITHVLSARTIDVVAEDSFGLSLLHRSSTSQAGSQFRRKERNYGQSCCSSLEKASAKKDG